MRRVLAALLAALAVGGAARLALARPLPGTIEVVVATTGAGVGDPLEQAGLELRPVPADLVPEGALTELSRAAGQSMTSALAAGEIVVEHDLNLDHLLAAQDGAETVAVFVALTEPAVLVALEAGDRIDVHSPVDGAVVAADALVLSVRRDEASGGVWLSIPSRTAQALAAARTEDALGTGLSISLRRPATG